LLREIPVLKIVRNFRATITQKNNERIKPMKTIANITHPAFAAFAFVCLVLCSDSRAVSPPPDGAYGTNTAEGFQALLNQTANTFNTAVGWKSLAIQTTAIANTGVGAGTLVFNTADSNTAVGAAALELNATGDSNTANGAFALFRNTTGIGNTACGVNALGSNTTGAVNTGIGRDALALNDTADYNTAVGWQALSANTTGIRNTAIGVRAGYLVQGDGNVDIGTDVNGDPGDTNVTRIRNVGSTPIVGGINVVIAGTGGLGDQVLGYASSSRRYKQDIEPMDKASETLFALRPVTFRAKNKLDGANVRHYGLIAEDVATVNPDLVVFNPQGKPETLRFDSINAMLLNEFLKEHEAFLEERRTVRELKSIAAKQETNAAKQEATIAKQQKQIEALTTGLQKVSDQLELSKSRPRTVGNDQ
jgi:endosialidase-like protein